VIVSIEAIKKALESLKDFDTWELIPLFTYTNDDHRPTNRGRLVQIKGGKIVQMKGSLARARHEVDREVVRRATSGSAGCWRSPEQHSFLVASSERDATTHGHLTSVP
jgi:hypothetical protein